MKNLAFIAIALVVLGIAVPSARGADFELDFAMDQDPRIVVPEPEMLFPPEVKGMLLSALDHSEADVQRQAAEAVAHTYMHGMRELATVEVIEALERQLGPDSEPIARLAAARALVVLGNPRSASALFAQLPMQGLDFPQVVEPALARWNFQPARKVWLARLDSDKTSDKLLILAVTGLGLVKEPQAAASLRRLALDRRRSTTIRLAAARALAGIQTEGLVEQAGKLAAVKTSGRIADRLVAASMLGGHRQASADALLLQLAVDPEPAVAGIAIQHLLRIDPKLLLPQVDALLASQDSRVRELTVRALVDEATERAVTRLAPLLDDPHPVVRNDVRRSLIDLASDKQLQTTILDAGMETLKKGSWRGKEQAVILLTALDHKPAAMHFLSLVNFDRHEVFEAAAWGLKKLAVADTLDGMFQKLQEEMRYRESGRPGIQSSDKQLAHLLEALGAMKYEPAIPELVAHIPKSAEGGTASPYGRYSRTAAVWALGHLYTGSNDAEIGRQLAGRLADTSFTPAEFLEVRQHAAISLGRMKAVDQLPVLENFQARGGLGPLYKHAANWAIHKITGREFPKIRTRPIGGRNPEFLQLIPREED